MRLLYANYVLAILVLFFFKIVLIDQVRVGFRNQDGQNYSIQNQRSIASTEQLRLAPIR